MRARTSRGLRFIQNMPRCGSTTTFTRVFDALWLAPWCAADPGFMKLPSAWVPALRSSAEEALHRVRDTICCDCHRPADRRTNRHGSEPDRRAHAVRPRLAAGAAIARIADRV